MSATQDFLTKTEQGGRPRPLLVCNDGFSMSVQAGDGWYSSQNADGSYKTVEIGIPSTKVKQFNRYKSKWVYGYVPIKLVDRVIARHGGLKDG